MLVQQRTFGQVFLSPAALPGFSRRSAAVRVLRRHVRSIVHGKALTLDG